MAGKPALGIKAALALGMKSSIFCTETLVLRKLFQLMHSKGQRKQVPATSAAMPL